MDVTTKKETRRPLGVIGCLAAGFDVLSRNVWLIVLPVLLDLFLWLGPQLSLAALMERVIAFVAAQPPPDPATVSQLEQAIELLDLFGERFNLLSLLSALPFLNVPSLLAQRAPGMVSPLGDSRVFLIESVWALIAWGMLLLPIGLMLGFLYVYSLARRILAMRRAAGQGEGGTGDAAVSAQGPPSPSVSPPLQAAMKLIRVFSFTALLLGAAMVVAPLWMLVVGAALAIAQPLGLVAWALSVGLGVYLALHLLFVVPSLVLGGRGLLQAVWESFLLIHMHFSSVIGLVVLGMVIYEGLRYVWSLPSGDSWSLLIGVLGNACIATGLTAATFVFYQERVTPAH